MIYSPTFEWFLLLAKELSLDIRRLKSSVFDLCFSTFPSRTGKHEYMGK